MGASISISDGQIVAGTTNGADTSTDKKSNAVDSDTFLTLLVAEMQYQDPLEPTSNTEWVSQYATFTQVEQLDAMASAVEQSSAYDLVGKYVIVVDATSSTGYTYGTVDYVTFEDGEIKLSIGDQYYSIDDIDSVVDGGYLDAVSLSETFEAMVKALPEIADITVDDAETVAAVREAYDSMTSYQQGFVNKVYLNRLVAIEERIAALQETLASQQTETEIEETADTAQVDP